MSEESGSPIKNNVEFWLQFFGDQALKKTDEVREWIRELWESDKEFFSFALSMRSIYNDLVAAGMRKRKAFYLAAEEFAERLRKQEEEEREIEIKEEGEKKQ